MRKLGTSLDVEKTHGRTGTITLYLSTHIHAAGTPSGQTQHTRSRKMGRREGWGGREEWKRDGESG